MSNRISVTDYYGQTDFKGFFGTFDGITYINPSVGDLQGGPAQRVLVHETMHHFQNFYTATGLSYFQILFWMNAALDDILTGTRMTVSAPLFDWCDNELLSSPGFLNADDQSKSSFFLLRDRITRLLTQLSTASGSAKVLQDLPDEQLGSVRDAIARADFSLDLSTARFTVGNSCSMPIDYQAICESMALAQELLFAATNKFAEINSRQPGGGASQRALYGRLFDSNLTESLKLNPRLLQYTFPLLYLLKSGYNGWEAARLTVLISYIALSSKVILAGVPEEGTERITKFGAITAKIYAALLQAAFEDKFLDLFESESTTDEPFERYLDKHAEKAGLEPISVALKATSEYFAGMLAKSQNKRQWMLPHARQIWANAIQFIERIRSATTSDGVRLLVRPQDYLCKYGNTVVIFDGANFRQLGSEAPEFDDSLWTCVLMHARKCLLLGPDPLFETLQTLPEHRQLLAAHFRDGYGVMVKGWAMEPTK